MLGVLSLREGADGKREMREGYREVGWRERVGDG